MYPDHHLARMRLLQRYMSAGIACLEISRGGFVVSLLLLVSGTAFIVIGRFFFWERHRLYGCRPDYETSIETSVCPVDWQRYGRESTDTSTVACLVSGSVILLLAFTYPYALLAVKGSREETEELRSIVHLEYHSLDRVAGGSLRDWETAILHAMGLDMSHRPWQYLIHPNLENALARRRWLRRFAACIWTESFARIAIEEYAFPIAFCLLALANALVAPMLMTGSSVLLRLCSAFASLATYVAILPFSIAAFVVILVLDPTAWKGCITFWATFSIVHTTGFAIHSLFSRVPILLRYSRVPKNVPASVLQEILNKTF